MLSITIGIHLGRQSNKLNCLCCKQLKKSLKYKVNINGPSTDPCGTLLSPEVESATDMFSKADQLNYS